MIASRHLESLIRGNSSIETDAPFRTYVSGVQSA